MSQSNDDSVKASEAILQMFADGLGIRHIEAVLLDYGQEQYDLGHSHGYDEGYGADYYNGREEL